VLRFVLFTHVLGAIVAVGGSMTYGIWMTLARRTGPREEAFAFRGIRFVDSRMVTPAFGWQLVSGLLMVFVFHVASLREAWLSISLGLYAFVTVVAFVVVAPGAARAGRALETAGPGAPEYVRYRRTMRMLTPLIALATIAIVYLMVTKPV
jgi:uncharacterized membrane protein